MSATSKQISYIQSLISKRHGHSATHSIPAALRRKYGLTAREARYEMTRSEASDLIGRLTN